MVGDFRMLKAIRSTYINTISTMPAQYPTRPTHHAEAPSGSAPDNKPHDELKLLSGDEHAHKAVILVGGINNNYTYFSEWKDSLSAKDTAVMGFDHDHRSENMKTGAHNLAEAISALKEKGFDEVTVVAHSMGGLVSKGALNEMVSNGSSENFKHIEMHSFGTPWGGFAAADLAIVTPAAQTISNAIGFPMGPEIGPHSDYMKSLAQEWPKNMEFHVYSGTTDNVATPKASSTIERYDEITGKANSFVMLEGFKHPDYVEAGASVMQASRGEAVAGMESVAAPSRQQDAQGTPAIAEKADKAPVEAASGAGMSM